MTGSEPEVCRVYDDPDGPIVVRSARTPTPRMETALRALAAAVRRDMANAEPLVCECRHYPEQHANRTGRCQGRDSYDQPCACPSYEEMDDGDGEDEM